MGQSTSYHLLLQMRSENEGTSRTDRFLVSKELLEGVKTTGEDGVKDPLNSFRGAFTLPWDDWPPQQVHSLFFAHKELPRTEEFDREELGILRELERAAIEAEGAERTEENFRETGEGKDAKGSLEKDDKKLGEITSEQGSEGEPHIQGGESQSQSKVGTQSGTNVDTVALTELSSSTARLQEADEGTSSDVGHASAQKLDRGSTQVTDGARLRGQSGGEQVEGVAGRVGLDDDRGDKDRQLRIERVSTYGLLVAVLANSSDLTFSISVPNSCFSNVNMGSYGKCKKVGGGAYPASNFQLPARG